MAATSPLSPHRWSQEPASGTPLAGSARSLDLVPLIARLRSRSGTNLVAIVLSGSHATGEAAWAEPEGGVASLSDLDLYVILRDEASCDRARQADRDDPIGSVALVPGLVGPLEVAYLTPAGLKRLPPRPGTITLRERGRVVFGQAGVLEQIPPYSAKDISAEERLALLENRGAELLGAGRPAVMLGTGGAWRSRHATLKVALDLAGSLLLERGEWPLDSSDRVRCAERALSGSLDESIALTAVPSALPRLWRDALAWRTGLAHLPDPQTTRADWHMTVRAWCWLWRRVAIRTSSPDAAPWSSIRTVARRAPWPRRARQALAFRPRAGAAPSLAARLRHLSSGTPVHRLTGSVTTLLFSAAMAEGAPRLTSDALRLLDGLGVVRGREWDLAADRAWGLWMQWVAGLSADPS